MVSVGKPHIGNELIQHLGFQGGENHLFVDPDNELYDSLDLNRGVQRTFFNANTAFAFLDRFTRKDGTKDLGEVLSKWSQGTLLRLAKHRLLVASKKSMSNHHF
jgi:hypothetical protein